MVECSALMYASCAWFWEDISRIEAVQMLKFSASSMELAKLVGGVDLEPEFRQRLSFAIPNDPRFSNGSQLFDRVVRRRSGS